MRWITEALLFAIYFAFGISWLAYSPLLPEIEAQFGLDHAKGAMLISTVSLAKAFVPLLAGVIAARLGVGRAIALGAWLSALALLAPFAPSFGSLLAIRFLFGVGGAIVVTLMGAMVMSLFPARQLPFINGLNNVAVNVGVTAALFTAVPCAQQWGWRATLCGFGVVSFVLAVVWQVLQSRVSGSVKSRSGEARLSEVWRQRETWLIALAFTGPLSLYLVLNTWLTAHYVESFGLARASAAGTSGVMNLAGIPTAILAGLFTTKLGLRRPLLLAAGCLMVPAALGLVLFPELRTVCAVLLGISFFLYVAPLFTIPMELPGSNPARVALMQGTVFSLAYLVSFAAPVLCGWIRDWTGSYQGGLVLFAVLSGSLAVAAWLLPETGSRRAG